LKNIYQYSNNYNNINLKSTTSNLNKLSSCLDEKNNENNQLNNYNPINFNLNNQANFENKKFSTIVSNQINNSNKIKNSVVKNNQNTKIRSNSIDGLNIYNINSINNLNNINNSNVQKTSNLLMKHDGFSLNNIPRVDNLYTMSDTKFLNYSHTNFHCKKIINSLNMSNNLKIKDEMQKISKVELRKVNKAKNPKEFVEKLCDLENTKYGRIFSMQKSKDFLDQKQLPEIKYEKKNIEINTNYYNNGNSKFMGVDYNPFNYDLIASKNRTKRNVFGTLFIN